MLVLLFVILVRILFALNQAHLNIQNEKLKLKLQEITEMKVCTYNQHACVHIT